MLMAFRADTWHGESMLAESAGSSIAIDDRYRGFVGARARALDPDASAPRTQRSASLAASFSPARRKSRVP